MKGLKDVDHSCALIQYLKSLGIKVRTLKCETEKKSSNGLVFGNPLHVLPQYSLPDGNGTIPRFLVESCSFLKQHLRTEGLFRISGSAFRMKNLKEKLQQGVCSLEFTSASDVAGLLKQFFRELPEPIVPAGYRDPLCQAQQLRADGERKTATILLTCLMPRINAATLNYFLSFLQTVAARSEENKMGVRNLAVVLTPNLFQLFDVNDKLAGNMQKVLPLLTVVTESLIIQAESIGQLPPFILDKLPGFLAAEPGGMTSSGDAREEGRQILTMKQRRKLQWRVGVIVSGALSKLKTSITPQPDRASVAALQQTVSPVVNSPLTAKRKATDNSSHTPGINTKKRRAVTETTEADAEPESPLDSRSPGMLDQTFAVDHQAEDLVSEGMESPSVFLKPSVEGAMPSAGGSKTPSTSSMSRPGCRRAACKCTPRVLPKREASPWPLGDQKERVRKSLRCFGLNRGKDSKFSLPLNSASEEMAVTCCDLLNLTMAGSVDESPLAGTGVLLIQRSDPLDSGIFSRNELENYASHHLSPHMDINTLSEAELSKSDGDLLQDSLGLITSPSHPAPPAKQPRQLQSKLFNPNVASTALHTLGSEISEWAQPCRDHANVLKLDLGSPIGNDVPPPYFLQVPHCSSVANCKGVRRSLSLPEAISESKGKDLAEGDVEGEFSDDPDVYLKTLGGCDDASCVAVNENTLNFNRQDGSQSVLCAEACHHSTEVEGCSEGVNGTSNVARGLLTPFIVLVDEDCVDRSASNSLHDTEDRFQSAERCKGVPFGPVSDTNEQASPQPSRMEMARSSVTEYIRRLNKRTAKRCSSKPNFLKVPGGGKQTPYQSSVLRFAQHASALFGKNSEGRKRWGARQPMRRSLSLESALRVCKDREGLEDGRAGKHSVNDPCSPEANNPDCSDQHLFTSKQRSTPCSPQRLSLVRSPVLEDRRNGWSPDKPGTGVGPDQPRGLCKLRMANDT